MRLFETKAAYSSIDEKWIELYFINGEEFSSEEYFSEMELESEEVEEEEDEDLYDDSDEDDDFEECDCVRCRAEDIMDGYVERLQGLFCPHCIKEVLVDFLEELIDGEDEDDE